MFDFYKKKTAQYKKKYSNLRDEGKGIINKTKRQFKKDVRDFAKMKDRPETDGAKNLRILRKQLLPAAFIFSLVILFNGYFALSLVRGNSMVPTLKENQLILIDRNSHVNMGDVVVIKDRDKFPDSQTVVKRVMAVSGDKIKCVNGIVFVNDSIIDQPFVYSKTEDFPEIVVDRDCIFVMGDNREHSTDSRKVGAISLENVVGRVIGLGIYERDYRKEHEEFMTEFVQKKW